LTLTRCEGLYLDLMFSIGDFARLGRVSVRMLRHYDTLGLLVPARVDPATGYRLYSADQLARLNRIIALRDLGFGLKQIASALDEEVGAAELAGMLRLRAELEAEVDGARARLAAVEARLALIGAETAEPEIAVVLKEIPAMRVARATAFAPSYETEDIDPVIGLLFERLCERMSDAGLVPSGLGIACYEEAVEGVAVHAALPVRPGLGPGPGFAVSRSTPQPSTPDICRC